MHGPVAEEAHALEDNRRLDSGKGHKRVLAATAETCFYSIPFPTTITARNQVHDRELTKEITIYNT
jgi:hypothetical protein